MQYHTIPRPRAFTRPFRTLAFALGLVLVPAAAVVGGYLLGWWL